MSLRNELLNGPLGFGAAPLGNMFRNIPDAEAGATVDAAWDEGTKYFDTAPFYGVGLSEIRLGLALAKRNRNEYRLSAKVGRIILDEVDTAERNFGEKGDLFRYGRPNKIVYDYSERGTVKSIEDSLKRLQVSHLDFVWVHDIAKDFHGDEWLAQFELARKGAFPTLEKLRKQGVITAWGLGVNRVEPCELAVDLRDACPTAMLVAGRYSLLDHEQALLRLMPACEARKIDVVIGGPYSSGVLVGGKNFEYAPASPEILARVERLKRLCEKYNVSIKAVALQFSLAHPAVAAIIPGASKPSRIAEDHSALMETIPGELWNDLRRLGLVSHKAPLPIDFHHEKAQATASIELLASADEVWELIGGFDSLPNWLSNIPRSQLSEGGRVRRLKNLHGEDIVERLEAFDASDRSYSYSILNAPFPVSDYLSTLRVIDLGDGSRVEWSGRFTPVGVSSSEASHLFQAIFEDGLKALKRHYSK